MPSLSHLLKTHSGWIFIGVLMILPIFRWWILYALVSSSINQYSWVIEKSVTNISWGLVLGTALGQGTLVAAAVGWSRGSIMVRCAVGIVLIVGLALLEGVVVFSCERIYFARDEWNLATCVTKIACCALLLLPLHILPSLGQVLLARIYGIEVNDVRHPAANNRPWQFRLIDLMAITVLFSLALGVGRPLAVYVPYLFSSEEMDLDSLRKLGVFAAGTFFVLNALITCFHVRRSWWANLLLVAMIALSISSIQSFSLWWFEAARSWRDGVTLTALCATLNITHVLFVLLAWWSLRRMGYQLERRETKVKGKVGSPSLSV